MDVIFQVMIRGQVQGVGFRAWAEVTAVELGVEGWIRNCRDGSVEAVLAGSEEVVLTMIELCRDGPPGARVAARLTQHPGACLAYRLDAQGKSFVYCPAHEIAPDQASWRTLVPESKNVIESSAVIGGAPSRRTVLGAGRLLSVGRRAE